MSTHQSTVHLKVRSRIELLFARQPRARDYFSRAESSMLFPTKTSCGAFHGDVMKDTMEKLPYD